MTLNVNDLEERGFKILEIEKATLRRNKASGGMYEAKALLQKDNIKLHMFMFSHLSDETPEISLEETKENLGIRGVAIDGKYMDTGWHCTPSQKHWSGEDNKDLYCHPEGWFNENKQKCLGIIMEKKSWHKIPLEEHELENLGFKKII